MNSGSGYYRPGRSVLQTVMSDLEARYHSSRYFRGLPTGFRHVDVLTNGLRDGELTVVISEEDDLATSFLLSLARNALFAHKTAVRFASFRHTEEYVATMLMSMCSQVPASQIISGDVDPETLAALVQAAAKIYESPLELVSVAPGTSGIETSLFSVGQAAPDVVLVDDVQWTETTIKDFVGSVRISAEPRNAPIVLSTRQDAFGASTPAFTDLFDTVFSLRPAARPDSVTLSIEKNRHGPLGSVCLEYESGGLGLHAVDSTGTWL